MGKRGIVGIIVVTVSVMLFWGCGNSVNVGEEKEAVTQQESALPENLSEFTLEELQGAIDRGILKTEDIALLYEPVTQSQCFAMMDAVAAYLNVTIKDKGAVGKESDLMSRSDAAARTVAAFYTPLFKNADVTQFPMSEGISQTDCEAVEDLETIEYLKWATTIIDFTSNTSMLERDNHYSIRPLDNMTVLECVVMMYRLSNYHIPEPEYTDFDKVADFAMSQELLDKANAMPKASADSFVFHGMVTDNKENDGTGSNMGLSIWYSKNQAKLLHDMGFNFTRVSNVFSEGGNGKLFGLLTSADGSQVNMTHLKNLDDYISWCIENDVHVCISMFYYPTDNDYSKNLEEMKLFWSMMTKHYKAVPNNALSFNLLNEPQGENENIETISQELLKSVRDEDPDRLIFLDALPGDESTVWGGPSRKPSYTLADENIVEAVHTYTGVFNGDHILGSGAAGYPSQDVWPFPYVHALLDEGSPITIDGNFTKNEQVTVRARFTYEQTDVLHISLDGQEIGSMSVLEAVSNDEGHSQSFTFILPADGKKIDITINGMMQLYDIVIVHNEPSEERIPYQTPWDFSYHTEKYSDKKITNIQCDWNMTNEDAKQHITVYDDTTYTAEKIEGWPLARVDYGYEGIGDYFKVWETFKQETGKNYMVQECGFYLWVNTPVNLRSHYMDEYLTVLDENGVSWNTLDRAWIYQPRDTADTESCEWDYIDGFRVNKTYLSVYQKHMK